MKYLKVYSLLLLTTLTATLSYAQGVEFVKVTHWKELFAKAKKENKMVLVDAYFEGCQPCKQMEEQVFVLPEVKKEMNDNFICTRIDFLSEAMGKDLQMKYAVTGFPTFLLLNKDGKLVSRFSGYQEADRFQKRLKEAMVNAKANEVMDGYSPLLDVAYPPFYVSLFEERKNIDPEILAKWLKGKDKKLEANAMPLLMTNNLNPELTAYFLANYGKMEELYGKEMVWDKRKNILMARLKTKIPQRDDVKFDAYLKEIEPLFSKKDWPYGKLDIAEGYYYNMQKDHSAFFKFAAANFNDDDNKVRYMAMNIRSDEERKLFAAWMKHVLTKDSRLQVLVIGASIMDQQNEKDIAKQYGEWATEKGKLYKVN